MKKKFRIFFYILLNTFFIFTLIDFFFGKLFFQQIGIHHLESSFIVHNEHFNYTLEKNLNSNNAVWGNNIYQLCTDERGFKTQCNRKIKSNYKFAFIGDSFTEGIGLPYEETFVGIFEKRNKNEVINMGVASYSPYIYKKKIKFFLDNNLSFEHLIVSIDLTDLEDDWKRKDDLNKKKELGNKLVNKKSIYDLKKFLYSYLPITYYISKRINWYLKVKYPNLFYFNHLDQKKNAARWSYINSYKDLNKKIKNIILNMTELKMLLDEKNIKMSVLLYPHQASILYDKKDSIYLETWKNFCKENKCYKIIDAYTPFFEVLEKTDKQYITKKYFIPGDSHFNFEGNKFVAEIIYNSLNIYEENK
jgi:hypothetical protein